jgi:thiol-disulfide isomerase/thioredoxin
MGKRAVVPNPDQIMKRFLVTAAFALGLLGGAHCTFAAEAEPATGPAAQAKADLQVLVGQVQGKINDGKKAEVDFTSELTEFDRLLAKYKGQQSDEVAQILLMKAMLYVQVFTNNTEKGLALIEQLKKDFPESKPGKQADTILASMKRQEEAKKVQRGLVVGAPFPDFDEKDLDGKPLAIANYKGKIVLVDFWATWCGPCVAELPNVLEAYQKYHDKGFEIVGISLDSDKARLASFLQTKKMPWRQYFDGKQWENKLAGKYGINSIPSTFLLDREGKIIAKNLRGEALDTELAKALESK